MEKSKTLRVYAMCGSTFSDKKNSKIAEKALNDSKLKQLYLISDENKNDENIQIREKELPKDASGKLKTKVINSKNDFEDAKKNNSSIEYRQHREKVGFRLILLDHCIYLSQQEKNKYGKDTEIQRIKCGTPAYINFSDYFDKLWNNYAPKENEIKQI